MVDKRRSEGTSGEYPYVGLARELRLGKIYDKRLPTATLIVNSPYSGEVFSVYFSQIHPNPFLSVCDFISAFLGKMENSRQNSSVIN